MPKTTAEVRLRLTRRKALQLAALCEDLNTVPERLLNITIERLARLKEYDPEAYAIMCKKSKNGYSEDDWED